MKNKYGTLLLILLWGTFACQNKADTQEKNPPKEIAVAFYNTENFFDTQNNPTIEDDDFLPEGKNKWTQERYQKKVENISQVLDSLGAALVGLCEIENEKVLTDLLAYQTGYAAIHYDSPHPKGLDVALLYQKDVFEPILSKNFPVNLAAFPDFRTQDILLVSGKIFKKNDIHLLVVHWSTQDAQQRWALAKQCRIIIDEILRQNPLAKMIIMGDFGVMPVDSSLSQVLNAQNRISENSLFNAMYKIMETGQGTVFEKNWLLHDQILLTKAFLDDKNAIYIDKSAEIFAPQWLMLKGKPKASFGDKKYIGGYSDHLPVRIRFLF